MNKAAERLEAEGYRVEKAKKIRWAQQDFWGCWDILAIKKGQLRCVQVSAKPLYDRGVAYKNKLKEFPGLNETITKEYWWGQRGGGFQIICL